MEWDYFWGHEFPFPRGMRRQGKCLPEISWRRKVCVQQSISPTLSTWDPVDSSLIPHGRNLVPLTPCYFRPLNPLVLCAGEDSWRCQGCGDHVPPSQRRYRTVNEAWHSSCFRWVDLSSCFCHCTTGQELFHFLETTQTGFWLESFSFSGCRVGRDVPKKSTWARWEWKSHQWAGYS